MRLPVTHAPELDGIRIGKTKRNALEQHSVHPPAGSLVVEPHVLSGYLAGVLPRAASADFFGV